MDFETVYKTHGEDLMLHVLYIWERDNHGHNPNVMSFEDRWAYFIKATNDCMASTTTAIAVQ